MKWWAWIVVVVAILSVVYRKSITSWIDAQEAADADRNGQPVARLNENIAASNTGDLVKQLANTTIKRGDFINVEDRNSKIIKGEPLNETKSADVASRLPKNRDQTWWPETFYSEPPDGKFYNRKVKSAEPCGCGCGEITLTFYQ